MTLAPHQLTAIDRHLRKENWLLNEDLIAELTDHYTNGVSEQLAQGVDFDAAIRQIHRDFGGRKGLLKMEEDCQQHKVQQVDKYTWREVRLFFERPRAAITLSLFVGMYWLNAFSGIRESMSSLFSVGIFLISASVIGSVLASVTLYIKQRHEVTKTMLQPISFSFFTLYLFGVVQMILATYFPDLLSLHTSVTVNLWGSTVVETLVVIYLIASVIGLRKLFRNTIKIA